MKAVLRHYFMYPLQSVISTFQSNEDVLKASVSQVPTPDFNATVPQ